MTQYGSQRRETLEESGYKLIRFINGGDEVILLDRDTKNLELWFAHDDNPSYTVEICDTGYEFARSLTAEEKKDVDLITPKAQELIDTDAELSQEDMNQLIGMDDGESGFPYNVHDLSDDADALASAGMGTDEDYGYFGDD